MKYQVVKIICSSPRTCAPKGAVMYVANEDINRLHRYMQLYNTASCGCKVEVQEAP